MGPHRTYSTRPSFVSALGAIIIVPPVNLLLLKVRNKQRRRSNSVSPFTRTGNARRLKRARVNYVLATLGLHRAVTLPLRKPVKIPSDIEAPGSKHSCH